MNQIPNFRDWFHSMIALPVAQLENLTSAPVTSMGSIVVNFDDFPGPVCVIVVLIGGSTQSVLPMVFLLVLL